MTTSELFKQYLEHLFAGKRAGARELINGALDRGVAADKLLKNIIWPAMEQIDKLYRGHHIPMMTEQISTRINRMVADQLQGALAREPELGKKMIVVCGNTENHELGGQMLADLFEAAGWDVTFLGAGIPRDEILTLCSEVKPDVLTVYGALAEDIPGLRTMIELIREVGACDEMQVLVAGGVFARAEGLSQEIRADLYAKGVDEAFKVIAANPVRVEIPDTPEPGRRRKRGKAAPKAILNTSKAKTADCDEVKTKKSTAA